MSERDGVQDADYDVLRRSGFSREQCWAILACVRRPVERPKPSLELEQENRRRSGVRMVVIEDDDQGESDESAA